MYHGTLTRIYGLDIAIEGLSSRKKKRRMPNYGSSGMVRKCPR